MLNKLLSNQSCLSRDPARKTPVSLPQR